MSSPSSIASSSGRISPRPMDTDDHPVGLTVPKPPPEPVTPSPKPKLLHADCRGSYRFKGKMKEYNIKSTDPTPVSNEPKDANDEPEAGIPTVQTPSEPPQQPSTKQKQEEDGKISAPPRLRARPLPHTSVATAALPESSTATTPEPPSTTTNTPPPPSPSSIASQPTPNPTVVNDPNPLWDPYTNPSTYHDRAKPTTPPSTVSIDDLDRAKTLVLDLLGWGVEPEYLVNCGVSAQLIYRVFTDLNLRLPVNLRVPP